MPDMASSKGSWKWQDSNVIQYDRTSFLSASRCVVYAQRANARTGKNAINSNSFHPIGLVQSYNFNEQRQVDMIFELGSEVPFLVPGRTTGSISLSRMMIYGRDLLNVLYNNALNRTLNIGADDTPDTGLNSDATNVYRSLKDIKVPLNLMFAMFPMDTESMSRSVRASSSNKFYSRVFRNCWITARGESLAAGQTVIGEQVSILYEDVSRVQVASGK